ncbi:MAG: hypothetical protein ACEQSR_08595 [Candidatus Methylacidiphilales bacterium]
MGKIEAYLKDLISYAESAEPLNNMQFAMNQLKSKLELRLFNSNVGAKDVNGKNAGGYSKGYKAKRAANKRQTIRKDFNLTDTLAKSFKLAVEEREGKYFLIIYIVGNRNRNVAEYLTAQTKKKKGTGVLFGASAKELDERNKVILKLFENDLKEIGKQNE